MSLHSLSFALILGTLVWAGCASIPEPAVPELPTSAAAGDTTIVAVAAPATAKQTLPQFLGITGAVQLVRGCFDSFRNLLGMYYPELEATPPLLAITDPANLSEDAPPTAQAAAEIKAQEDAAAQKIKGIRYLATIGCGGCYPGVEEALLEALEDCTEAVRYEVVLAIRKTAGRVMRLLLRDRLL